MTYLQFSLRNQLTITPRHLPPINYLPYFISDPGQGIWNANNSCLLLSHASFPVTSQRLHLLSMWDSYKNKVLVSSWGLLINMLLATWVSGGLGLLRSSIHGTENDLDTQKRRLTQPREWCERWKLGDYWQPVSEIWTQNVKAAARSPGPWWKVADIGLRHRDPPSPQLKKESGTKGQKVKDHDGPIHKVADWWEQRNTSHREKKERIANTENFIRTNNSHKANGKTSTGVSASDIL